VKSWLFAAYSKTGNSIKLFFFKYVNMGTKNAEFYADSKSENETYKNFTNKKLF